MQVADDARTDFNQYSVQQMIAMLNAGDSGSIRSIADSWDALHQYLGGQASALDDLLPGFESVWQGGAAVQYESMLTDLCGGVRKLATHASTMRDLLHDSADALDQAKAQMPSAVSIPDLSPATVALATTPVQMMSPANDQEAVLLAARQQDAVAQVQAQQAAIAQAQAAHTRAAQVMTTLADRYSANTLAVPDNPAGADDAESVYASRSITANTYSGTLSGSGAGGGSGTSVGSPINFSGDPVTGLTADGTTTTVTDSPLFGSMVAAGLAAATAASAGRFGSIPAVPGFAQSSAGSASGAATNSASSPTSAARSVAQAGRQAVGSGAARVSTGKLAASGVSGAGAASAVTRALSGGSGGSGGFGGSSANFAGPSSAPTGFADLAGGSSSTSSALGGLQSGVAGAGSSSSAMPMGAMPMGGAMGAGADGSGRRTPQWLVETENVWGESSAVSPAVLGEG